MTLGAPLSPSTRLSRPSALTSVRVGGLAQTGWVVVFSGTCQPKPRGEDGDI